VAVPARVPLERFLVTQSPVKRRATDVQKISQVQASLAFVGQFAGVFDLLWCEFQLPAKCYASPSKAASTHLFTTEHNVEPGSTRVPLANPCIGDHSTVLRFAL
jgi:hypothetical protein